MDKLERKLKQDAAAIDAEMPAPLRARIDANLAPVSRQVPAGDRRWQRPWLGLAAVAGIATLAFILLPQVREPAEPDAGFATTPVYTNEQASPLALRVQPVELTEPLEQELLSLRADLENVRNTIEQELRTTL